MMCDCADARTEYADRGNYWYVTRICNHCGRVIDSWMERKTEDER